MKRQADRWCWSPGSKLQQTAEQNQRDQPNLIPLIGAVDCREIRREGNVMNRLTAMASRATASILLTVAEF
jgi:hypothetical protein